MKLEVKFRIWCEENKEMYFDSGSEYELSFRNGVAYYSPPVHNRNECFTFSTDGTCDKTIVIMQSIALYDKRSREIYVGDIVVNGLSGTWIVQPLENGSFSLLGIDGRYKDSNYSIDSLNSNCEVIGNIYENPDLLK